MAGLIILRRGAVRALGKEPEGLFSSARSGSGVHRQEQGPSSLRVRRQRVGGNDAQKRQGPAVRHQRQIVAEQILMPAKRSRP